MGPKRASCTLTHSGEQSPQSRQNNGESLLPTTSPGIDFERTTRFWWLDCRGVAKKVTTPSCRDEACGDRASERAFDTRLRRIMKPERETGNVKLEGLDQVQPARSDAGPLLHRTVDLSYLVAPVPLPCCGGRQVAPQKCWLWKAAMSRLQLEVRAPPLPRSPVSVLAPLLGSGLIRPPLGFEESFMLKTRKANKTHGPNMHVDQAGWIIQHHGQFERK